MSLQNTYVYNKALFREAGLERYLTDERRIQSWTIEEWEEYYRNSENVVDFTANNPNWRGVRAVFYPHIRKLLRREETAAQAAEGIDRDCNEAIEEGYRNGSLHDS